jgi:hypothetical protein
MVPCVLSTVAIDGSERFTTALRLSLALSGRSALERWSSAVDAAGSTVTDVPLSRSRYFAQPR